MACDHRLTDLGCCICRARFAREMAGTCAVRVQTKECICGVRRWFQCLCGSVTVCYNVPTYDSIPDSQAIREIQWAHPGCTLIY